MLILNQSNVKSTLYDTKISPDVSVGRAEKITRNFRVNIAFNIGVYSLNEQLTSQLTSVKFICWYEKYIWSHMDFTCVYVNAFLFEFFWAFGLRYLYVVHVCVYSFESSVHVYNYRQIVEKSCIFISKIKYLFWYVFYVLTFLVFRHFFFLLLCIPRKNAYYKSSS